MAGAEAHNARWVGDIAREHCGLALLGASPDCVIVASSQGVILAVNRPGLDLMQVDEPGAVIGQPWIQMWPAEARPEIVNAISRAGRGVDARFTAACPTAKGQPRWWDVSVVRIDPDSAVDHRLLAISRDITRTRQLENDLRISESRFHAVANNITQLAWMADPSGDVFWYNQRWYAYTGTTLQDMAGWGWTKVLHPDHIDRVVAKITSHLESGEPWEDTFPMRSADGAYRWFLARANPMHNEAGEITLWCGTNTDIHEQRAWAERLRQKARMIALSHEAILTWSMHDGIVAWNEGCKQLYGYELEEVAGRRTHDLLKTRLPMPVEDFERLLVEKGAWSGEILQIDKLGREVWVESRQEIVVLDDRMIVLELNRDITERRRADELKRLLLAELDHRVKNTLAIVQAIAAQTARRALSHREFTTSFNGRLQSLARAHNLLVSAQWSGAWLRELIVDQVAIGDEVDRRIAIEGENVFVPAQTALQLSLIVFELATNARKHGALSARHGRLHIHWVRDACDSNRVNLIWEEAGGPPVTQPETSGFGTTLLERTGQQPNLRARLEFASTGLKCSIAIEIGGSHDKPTTYFDTRREEHRRGSREAKQLEVMIVEDEPLIGMELEEVVTNGGFRPVGPLTSVEAALTAITQKPPDLVLLDGSLQGEPVDAIVLELQRRRIPYAMVTGFTGTSLPAGIDQIATPIVAKPVAPEKITRVLNDLAQRLAQRLSTST